MVWMDGPADEACAGGATTVDATATTLGAAAGGGAFATKPRMAPVATEGRVLREAGL